MAITTQPTDASVGAFLDSVESEVRRRDGWRIHELLSEITGVEARMWGPTIVGYGSVAYTNTTGTSDWPPLAFSPRTTALTLYGIFDGYAEPDPRFERLGQFTVGKGCLYIKNLDKVDLAVLEELARENWARETAAQ